MTLLETALGIGAAAVALIAPAVATPTAPPAPTAAPTVASGLPEPTITQQLIPFGAARKAQMARYSKIHYGHGSWRLHPRGVVEHYTATNSLESVFATFRSNQPDPELGQKPGVCAHFVIDRDGTIYQMVPLNIRCRHTVGLNHRTIGIEHVGMSDADVMGNRRQLRASLALTAWLQVRFGIPTGDVIGHNESLDSRFRRENYGPWRCQTHGDMTRATMNRFRSLLNDNLTGTTVDRSRPDWVDSGC